jgi:hypothetical protein
MKRQAPKPGIGPARSPTADAPARPLPREAGLLDLQQTAGNSAVVELLRPPTLQRANGDGEGDPGPMVGRVLLADAIEAQFTTAPYYVPSVVRLIRSAELAERDVAFASPSVRATIIEALDEDGRAEVFSALLAGRPYNPDWESTIFKTLAETKADEVSAEVNRRFTESVGLTRALDWSSPIDKPLARYWLRLRDDVVREEVGREEEQQFRDEVLAALATSVADALAVISGGLPEHVDAARASKAFMRSLRDETADFETFARLAEALGQRPPRGFDLRDRDAVRKAFADAWADSEPGAEGHEEGGWIYLNLVTGAISVERAQADAALSKRIQLGYPTKVADSVLIGTFHTHPIPGPYQGYASDADQDLADGWKVPSAIIPGEGRSKWFGVEVREHMTGGQLFPTY